MSRVVVTGVGVVTGGVTGGWEDVAAYLHGLADAAPAVRVADDLLSGVIEGDEARRLSRVCQLAVAAGRLAAADAGLDAAGGLGLVIGTEFGDLRSTVGFVDGYLRRGPQGLSALLFPNTVMNTMAASTAIAVRARELSLTLNAPTVAGELALARAATAVRSGRAEAVLAGGVDELDPLLVSVLGEMGAGGEIRGEGAGFVVLESWDAARPYGVGRDTASRALAAALEEAGARPADIGRVYASASGDGPRDRWEEALLEAAFGPHRPPRASLSSLVGRHSGTVALSLAAALRAPAGTLALLHAIARGGTQVAMVVRAGRP